MPEVAHKDITTKEYLKIQKKFKSKIKRHKWTLKMINTEQIHMGVNNPTNILDPNLLGLYR